MKKKTINKKNDYYGGMGQFPNGENITEVITSHLKLKINEIILWLRS